MKIPGSEPERDRQSESQGRTGWLDVMEQNLAEERHTQRSILGGGAGSTSESGGNWRSVPWGYLGDSIEHTSEVPWPEGQGISGVYPSSPQPSGATKKPERE